MNEIEIFRQLIEAAQNLCFHLNWLTEDQIRLEDPLSHGVFACLVAFCRARYSMGAHNVPVFSDYNLCRHREMLRSE